MGRRGKGFFAAEGLDYSFVITGDYGVEAVASIRRDDGGEIKTGAFETFGAGRDGADVSCACHWATSTAARERSGQLVTAAYSVAPCAIVVPPESPIRTVRKTLAGAADRGGLPLRQPLRRCAGPRGACSHPATWKPHLPGSAQQSASTRCSSGRSPPAAVWGVPLYIAEAFGFRKVIDATFMIGFLVSGTGAAKADVDKYLAALRRAQMDIDMHPEQHKHYHLRSVPEKYRDLVDVRSFGTGERIVFLPYTREAFTEDAAVDRGRTSSSTVPPHSSATTRLPWRDHVRWIGP